MSRTSALAASLLLSLAAAPAHAADGFLQNDTFNSADGGAARINAGVVFGDYQGPVVLLGAQGTSYPVTLTGVDVLYVPQNGNGFQDPFDLDIWNVPDGGVGAVASHGDLFSTFTTTQSIALTASTSAFNRYTLPSAIVLTAPIVVRLRRSYDAQTWPYAGTIALDQGPVVAGANWYDTNFNGIHSIDLPDAGIPDDNWIVRAVLDVDGGPAASTAGSSSGSSGSSSATAGSTGGTGSTGGMGSTGGATSGTSSGAPTLTSVTPAEAYSADTTTLTLVGSNFAFGAQAIIGPATLSDVTLRSPAVLSGTLRPGTAPGTYAATVINPDGRQATLNNALVVHPGSNPAASSGSAGASSSTGGAGGAKSGGCGCGSSSAGDLLGVPLLLAALWLRQRKPVTGWGR